MPGQILYRSVDPAKNNVNVDFHCRKYISIFDHLSFKFDFKISVSIKHYWLLTNLLIFDQNFDFWHKVLISGKILNSVSGSITKFNQCGKTAGTMGNNQSPRKIEFKKPARFIKPTSNRALYRVLHHVVLTQIGIKINE